MDWSLVLVSQGIETTINFGDESGWELTVPEQEYQRAQDILRQYRLENRNWPWRLRISRQGEFFDWASVGWVALVSFFFLIQNHSPGGFRAAGLMDAEAVSRGEWWRLFTAIFLHADIGHLAMNASIGLVLLGLTMGNLGTGVGLLAAYLAGVGGNVTTWLVYGQGHRSLGASGMVMGCLGLLAAQSIGTENRHSWKYALGGAISGVMLFVLLGTNPGSDVLAHVGGFASGFILGFILLYAPRLSRNTIANVLSGVAFCLLVVYPWWLALRKSAPQ
jgi:membrane associated rhomboid family serine protease